MIVRIWKGRTRVEDFDEYTEFTNRTAAPDYRSIEGNLGFLFLRRKDEHFGYFKLITYWTSLDAIRKFAGDDLEKAKYYPEDQRYLLEFEEKVEHFEVFGEVGPL